MRTSHIRTYTGPDAEKKAERVGKWFKAIAGDSDAKTWCVSHGVDLMKASNLTTNVTGGFLAPEDFDAAIIQVRETYGAFRRGAEIRPTSSDFQVRPRRVGGVTASFVAEGAPIPESQFQLDAVGATQKKLAVLTRASAELFDDSAADLGEFLTSEVGYAFAAAEDDCGFNGDGTQAFGGIAGLSTKLNGTASSVTAGAGHSTYLTLDGTDITKLMGAVMSAAIPGAAWYCSALCFATALCRIASGGGGGYLETRTIDGVDTPFFLGFPVRFSGKLPNVSTSLSGKPMLFFGDLRMSSVLVERQQQTILAISKDRSLDTDQVLIRGIQRMDIVNHSVGSTSSAGPVAQLLGA